MAVQSEFTVRFVDCKYPYDKVNEGAIILKSEREIIHWTLQNELSKRLSKAGIYVEEARLAYSTDIAKRIVKRQPVEVILATKEKIIQNSLTIVGQALNSLKQNHLSVILKNK